MAKYDVNCKSVADSGKNGPGILKEVGVNARTCYTLVDHQETQPVMAYLLLITFCYGLESAVSPQYGQINFVPFGNFT
jgi:hypothetical protein